MVNLLLSPEKDLRRSHVVKTIYDPACGTGGMLSVAEKYIADLNFDRATSRLDHMVSRVESVIERLQEYRSALIAAAIAGKIDVRAASGMLKAEKAQGRCFESLEHT